MKNLLVICTDTFRWDYIGAYGNDWIQTPHLDKLASESVIFDEAFGEGIPTLPVRRVLMTGRHIFPFEARQAPGDKIQCHGWHPLYDEDVTLAEWLGQQGYISGLFYDLYHMMRPGMNFHRGYTGWYYTRGQEDDPYRLPDRDRVSELAKRAEEAGVNIFHEGWPLRHLVHRDTWQSDEDTPCAQTVLTAVDWLRDYSMPKPWYMHVELFDPHEPWDPPLKWARLYDPEYDSLDGVVAPMDRSGITDRQFNNIKNAYAGECSMVDHWVGHLLNALDEMGQADNTVVVFTSDHGCIMGEQDQIHKLPPRVRNQVTQVPLFIRDPARSDAGTHVKGFCQHTDIMPTLLKTMDLPIPDRVTGRDLWPQVEGDTGEVPETIVTAFGPYASVRNHKWNYIHPWHPYKPESYKHLPAELVNELYDLENDPEELVDVLGDHPDVGKEMAAYLDAYMKQWQPHTSGTIHGIVLDNYKMSGDTRPEA